MKINKRDGDANIAFEIRDIEGDMGERTFLDLIQQADGDIIIALQDRESGKRLNIEFCSSAGGGKNPEIAKKIRELIAILCKQAGI